MRGKLALPQMDAYAERGDDLYETPPCAIEALLRAENIPRCIWEPAAGRGAITDVLRTAGHTVFASDLVDYGVPNQHKLNFFQAQLPIDTEAIVTNPPFKDAPQFVRRAIQICPRVFMLLRLAFLESTSRTDILEGPLARVHIFRDRLPRMHRDGWAGPKTTSSIAFAWFVWERHSGPTQLHRISWRK
jgi:hypothetical protein